MFEIRREPLELARAADHRQVELASDRRSLRVEGEEPMDLDGLGLSLELERPGGLGCDRVADEVKRGGSDQSLAGRSRLLEPRSEVDGVACHEGLAFAGDDLTRVDADANLELERSDHLLHLRGGSDRAQRIVLVRLGNAEHGHHCVADALLDRAAVALDDLAHLLVIPGHQPPRRVRMRAFSERRGTDDVAEEDGDRLSHLARLGCLERAAAVSAETETARILLATSRTDCDSASVLLRWPYA